MWHLLTWRNCLNQWLSQRYRQEEGQQTIACMGMRLQHNGLSLNSISPHKEVLPLQCMNRLINWVGLFISVWSLHLTIGTVRTKKQKKTAVKVVVRQRSGSFTSTVLHSVICVHTCYLLPPIPCSFPFLPLSFLSRKINNVIHSNAPQAL